MHGLAFFHFILFYFLFCLFGHVFILCFFLLTLWEGFAHMDLVFFLLTHSASSRYPLPFLIFELLFIRDGSLFSGFLSKKVHLVKFLHFLLVLLC